jgi:hypothetical protein
VALGATLLIALLSAALLPSLGVVSADTSCVNYTCTTSSPATPLWAWAAIGVIVVLAILSTAFLLMRRKGGRPPAEPYNGPSEGAAGATMAGGAAAAAPDEAPAPDEAAPAAPSAEYIEQPEDTAVPPAVLPAAAAATGAAAGAAAGTAADDTNIDALMDELDKISGEILKKDQRTKGNASADSEAKDADAE